MLSLSLLFYYTILYTMAILTNSKKQTTHHLHSLIHSFISMLIRLPAMVVVVVVVVCLLQHCYISQLVREMFGKLVVVVVILLLLAGVLLTNERWLVLGHLG